MKSVGSILCTAISLGLVGCASASNQVTLLDPVGPSMAMPSKGAQEGYLQVYSAHEPAPGNVFLEAMIYNNDFGQNEFLRGSTRTDYALYDTEGKLLKRIRNAGDQDSQLPTIVALSPGVYRVEATAVNQKTVSIPVAIAPGQATLVHLDGNWQPPQETASSEVVSLPHGVQVGWRATISDSERFHVRERVEN